MESVLGLNQPLGIGRLFACHFKDLGNVGTGGARSETPPSFFFFF